MLFLGVLLTGCVEVLKYLRPLRGVVHFRVELYAVQWFILMFHGFNLADG